MCHPSLEVSHSCRTSLRSGPCQLPIRASCCCQLPDVVSFKRHENGTVEATNRLPPVTVMNRALRKRTPLVRC